MKESKKKTTPVLPFGVKANRPYVIYTKKVDASKTIEKLKNKVGAAT